MQRLYSIDFLRTVFAIGIVLLHTLGQKEFSAAYGGRASYCVSQAYLIVECFFILSGFFLIRLRSREPAFASFLTKKVARLWPVLACSMLTLFLMGRINFTQLVMNSCFLQCCGITSDYKGIAWFVSPLFWTLLFYYALYRAVPVRSTFCLIVAILVYWAYVMALNDGRGFSRAMAYGFVSLAMCRAVAGVGLGILLAQLVCVLKPDAETADARSLWPVALAEIASLTLLFINLFYRPLACSSQFVVVIAFSSLLVLFATERGFVVRLLGHRFWGFTGRYAYSIYVMQAVAFTFLSWSGFACGIVRVSPLGGIVLYEVAACGLGVLTYHIVEVPCGRWLARRVAHDRLICDGSTNVVG